MNDVRRTLLLLLFATLLVVWRGITDAAHQPPVPQHHPSAPQRVALWIDGKQIEQFAGIPIDVYIIKYGAVVPYLQDAHFDSQLPILPPEVDFVELTWMAEEMYMYKFSDLRSLDPQVMYDPLLSVPSAGIVPNKRSVFQLAIPCTGRLTAIASMYIVLHMTNGRGERVPGSPLKFHLRKRCLAFENRKTCRQPCKNGGKCNDLGRCECKAGYSGLKCEQAVCFPECLNNATCVSPGKCMCSAGFYGKRCQMAYCSATCQHGGRCVQPDQCVCSDGYYGNFCQYETGQCQIACINGGTCSADNKCLCPQGYSGLFCQKPLCSRWCGVHGKCVDVDLCECHRGWRGKLCNKTVKYSEDDDKDGNLSRKRRRRKLRHSSSPFRFSSQREARREARRAEVTSSRELRRGDVTPQKEARRSDAPLPREARRSETSARRV